jgi:hypothetical protein
MNGNILGLYSGCFQLDVGRDTGSPDCGFSMGFLSPFRPVHYLLIVLSFDVV